MNKRNERKPKKRPVQLKNFGSKFYGNSSYGGYDGFAVPAYGHGGVVATGKATEMASATAGGVATEGEGRVAQGEVAGLPEPATGVYLAEAKQQIWSFYILVCRGKSAGHLVAACPLPPPEKE